jgi:hypothetical protein
VCAKPAGVQHVDTHHGSSVGSVARPAATTRAGESVHTLPCSTGGRDHIGDRCAPAARSAGNCTADSSPRWPSSIPHAALDNAANCGHKSKANASLCRARMRRPGVLSRNLPGPSLIRRPGLRIAAGTALEVGGRALRIEHRPSSNRVAAHKQRGEQFWGCCASIPKIRRIYVTVNKECFVKPPSRPCAIGCA